VDFAYQPWFARIKLVIQSAYIFEEQILGNFFCNWTNGTNTILSKNETFVYVTTTFYFCISILIYVKCQYRHTSPKPTMAIW
jgi:hypothetical protein